MWGLRGILRRKCGLSRDVDPSLGGATKDIFFFFSLHVTPDTGASDHHACPFY